MLDLAEDFFSVVFSSVFAAASGAGISTGAATVSAGFEDFIFVCAWISSSFSFAFAPTSGAVSGLFLRNSF